MRGLQIPPAMPANRKSPAPAINPSSDLLRRPPSPARGEGFLAVVPSRRYRSPVPVLVPIDDPADQRLDAYRDIRERDLVGRRGLFVAEGETVLRVLAGQDGFRPLSVLIAAKRLDKLQPILDCLASDVPVYLAGQAVLDGIVGFELHRGILAIAEKPPARSADALMAGLPARALVMALVRSEEHTSE